MRLHPVIEPWLRQVNVKLCVAKTAMLWKILRERSRSRAVRNLGILGAPVEPGLDQFTRQAASAFAAPMSFLTILHNKNLWIRASVGLDVACVPREDGFCHYAVDHDDLFEVCDAPADPLFRSLPCVTGEPYVRYYLGAPLTMARDLDVGMLCVLDTKSRPPASRDQRAYLAGLARQAAQAIERRADTKGQIAA